VFRDGYSPNVRLGGGGGEGKGQPQDCECRVLWLVILGVINTPLAPLINCQHDLTEDGKVVREAFRAGTPPAHGRCCRVQGGVPSQPGLGARRSRLRLHCHLCHCQLWEVENKWHVAEPDTFRAASL